MQYYSLGNTNLHQSGFGDRGGVWPRPPAFGKNPVLLGGDILGLTIFKHIYLCRVAHCQWSKWSWYTYFI